jgi:hypothetical protein
MLLLNIDALIVAADRGKKYFSDKEYGRFLKFGNEALEDVEEGLLSNKDTGSSTNYDGQNKI